jgi:hypothetical protein
MRVKTATGSTGGTRRAQHLSARAVCALCAPLILPLALAGCNAPTPTGWESLGDANVMIGLSMARDPKIPQLLYVGMSNGQIYRIRIESHGASPGTGVPNGASVPALISDPSHEGTLWAGTDHGVYVTRDYGTTWRAIGRGLPGDDVVDALALAPATGGTAPLYAGTEQHGAYLSLDGGSTWTAANAGLPSQADVYGLTIDGGTIFASLVGGGVYASTDGAATWAARGTGLPAGSDTFAVIGSAAPAPAATATTSSTTPGTQASPTATVAPAPAGAASALLYAGTSKGAFTSRDAGQTWTPAGLAGSRVLALAADPVHPGVLYAGTDSDVFTTVDGGQHWQSVAPGLGHQVAALAVLPGQKAGQSIVFAAAGRIYRYPPQVGGGGSPLGAGLSIAVFLILVVITYLYMRRSRRILDSMTPSSQRRRDPGGPPETTDPANAASQNGHGPGAARRGRADI